MCRVCDPKGKYNDCICENNWSSFNDTFDIIKNYKTDILKSPLRISTITLCCNFNSAVNLDKFYSIYKHLVKYTPNTKRFISSTSFDNPKKLADYFNKNQLYAKGGKTRKNRKK